MLRNKIFIAQFLLIAFIGVLHITALELYWYWVFPWFDILVHFLGGLWATLISLWFFFESGYVKVKRRVRNISLVAFFTIFFVAIGWEVFEFLAGVPIVGDFAVDTTIDLIIGTLGALMAWIYYTSN
ncbi:hypothetical protein CL631_00745 [bacterium]|jgi:hypothetical protein|nr:hypothetical protein [bacterium]MDP6659434.1 hypothetical protein [Candidatus Paceibacterota bacterium]|tara:strand:- start:5881 stop:6261 length:381 start_codon:yes stop_codon:yes gene_type:complete